MKALILAVLAALTTDVALAQTGDAPILIAGDWELRPSERGSPNGPACVLTPKTRSRIQVSQDRLTVTGLPKNSVFNFQYRIDDKPASTPTRPSDAMQNEGAIDLDGDALTEILNGRRFQIRILDKWHEAITEDLDLSGLKDLHEKLAQLCK